MNPDQASKMSGASFERAIALFRTQFQAEPRWVSHAPGRVNLIGEHIDYNDGFVLPAAIDRRLSIAARPTASEKIRIFSEQEDSIETFDLKQPFQARKNWTDYITGVFWEWIKRNATPCGLELCIASDVPLGAGLSSSAALEVATATLLEDAWHLALSPTEKALACQSVEANYVGMPCGIMDQFIVSLGKKDHLLLIDCQANTHELVPTRGAFPTLLIINSNVRHALTDGGYAARRRQCDEALAVIGERSWRNVTLEALEKNKSELSKVHYQRARHVVSEIDRTQQAVKAIQERNMEQLGKLLYTSHDSLRHDYDVSCVELDWIIDRLQSLGTCAGIWGGRITGGGFGGCAVALVEPDAVSTARDHIQAAYHETFGIQPDFFITHPSGGCECVDLDIP
jgi:galactokinase